MKYTSLAELNLHDSILKEIVINKVKERIIMNLDYIVNYDNCKTTPKKLIFFDVRLMVSNINFGYISSDAIKEGYEISESKILNDYLKVLNYHKIKTETILSHFCIITITSNSRFDIIASYFKLY